MFDIPTMSTSERYSRLSPLPLQTRINVSCSARRFFSPACYDEMCHALGSARTPGRIEPFTVRAFLSYLSRTNTLPEADRCQQRVRELLDLMVGAQYLAEAGTTSDPLLGRTYYCLREFTVREERGNIWLAAVLGPDFLQQVYSSLLVHVTGKTEDGDTHAGTGILLTPTLILTCAHVFEEMQLDPAIIVQGMPRDIARTVSHPKVDIGIIEVKDPCDFYTGLSFQEPSLLEEVYVFGFPKVPFTAEAALIIHKGEVTNPMVRTLDAQSVFLFSAIARPGNSGGPIVSRNGCVVGIVSRDLIYKDNTTLPFYAGTPTSGILKALAEIDSTIKLPIEDYS